MPEQRWVCVSKFKPIFTEATYEQALMNPRCGTEDESDIFRLITKEQSEEYERLRKEERAKRRAQKWQEERGL